jgi:hypothetical protein
VVAPALFAAIGLLAGAKIALLAREAIRTLADPAVLEAPELGGEWSAPAEVESGRRAARSGAGHARRRAEVC